MAPPLSHSILRQYFEVEVVGTEATALALQGKLAGLCNELLLPVIERAFERCCPPHRVIRIDQLALDLGSVALARVEQELPGMLERSLRTAMDAQLAALPEARDGRARYTTTALAMDDALAYFLQYGTLPPQLRLNDGRNFEATIRALQDEAGTLAPPLSNALSAALHSAVAVERLVGQFSVTFQRSVLARMGGAALNNLNTAIDCVSARSIGVTPDKTGTSSHAMPTPKVMTIVERLLLRAALHCAARSADSSVQALVREALAISTGHHLAKAALKATLTRGKVTPAPQPEPTGTTPAVTFDPAKPSNMQTGGIEHPDQMKGIFVENAGLALLHPFIAPLLDTLGISSGERLLEPARALAILHFLASGEDSGPEYALALPKVLCALPLTANIDAGVVASAAEKAESHEMLEAVIRHWSKLQNTSPDGLRGAFLMRPGKLSERNGEWVLQVEAHAADILLGDLPWGVSAIRLPWMKKILWVDWGHQ